MWGAAWLYKATNNQYYLNYLGKNGDALGGTGWAMTEFGWDVKYAGVQTLVAKVLIFNSVIINFYSKVCMCNFLKFSWLIKFNLAFINAVYVPWCNCNITQN